MSQLGEHARNFQLLGRRVVQEASSMENSIQSENKNRFMEISALSG
jgi:hypothetical protein